MSRTTIQSVQVEPLNIPFPEPFPVALGIISSAQNVLITITLNDGTIGYGECSPFPPVTGGYEQRGGIYDLSGIERGLGIEKQ